MPYQKKKDSKKNKPTIKIGGEIKQDNPDDKKTISITPSKNSENEQVEIGKDKSSKTKNRKNVNIDIISNPPTKVATPPTPPVLNIESDDSIDQEIAEETLDDGRSGVDNVGQVTLKFTNESIGEDLTFIWDFGDGASSTERNPIHTYQEDGLYNVSLTSINSAGSNTITDIVDISEPSPPPPPPPPPPNDPRIEITKKLFIGSNIRHFYGVDAYSQLTNGTQFFTGNITPEDFIEDYLTDVDGVITIQSLNVDGTINKTYTELLGGSRDLDVIESGVNYNIFITNDDLPSNTFWDITYLGLNSDPLPRYYTEFPFTEIPSNLPLAYRVSTSSDVPVGQKCSNCKFYEPDGNYCNNWNAEVRANYYCASWNFGEYKTVGPNSFTQYIESKDTSVSPNLQLYNWFQNRCVFKGSQYGEEEGEPNIDNFLQPLDPLFSSFGAFVFGDYLRRILHSGDAFNYDNVSISFLFETPFNFLGAVQSIQNNVLEDFRILSGNYDVKLQASCEYVLKKKNKSNLPDYYPSTLTIILYGNMYGDVENIISYLDFANGKLAYTPKYNNTNLRKVVRDNRIGNFRTSGVLHVDILKQNIRERLIQYLNDPTEANKLDGDSALNFLSWVARRAPFSESMQTLYNVLLNAPEISLSPDIGDALQLSLGETIPDNPPPANMPLGVNLVDVPPSYNFWEDNEEVDDSEVSAGGNVNMGDEVVGEEVTQQETGDVGGGY